MNAGILITWVKFGKTLPNVLAYCFCNLIFFDMNQFFCASKWPQVSVTDKCASAAMVLMLAGAVAILQGCAYISHESVYEGVRGVDKTKTTGTTQTPAALPNYDRYEKERDALKK
jgi:hypothetical protein